MSTNESEQKNVDPFKSFIAGGVGGMCLIIIGHPPDTIKVNFVIDIK
jgi:solute carrier family 25 carnitine/acylcarnitine transporter 20/29